MTLDERMKALASLCVNAEMRDDREVAEAEERRAREHAEEKERRARHDREMEELRLSQAKTEATLRRAIRLAVEDARRQRRRNAEFDQRHAEFDQRRQQAEIEMQELRVLLKAFLERSGNGKH